MDTTPLGRLTGIGSLLSSWPYAYGDLGHPHALTSIYNNVRGSPITIYSAIYHPAGNMICRDPSSSTCAGTLIETIRDLDAADGRQIHDHNVGHGFAGRPLEIGRRWL